MTSHANVGVGTLALTHPPPARSNAGPWPGSKPKTRPAQGTVRGVAAYGRAAPTCETAGGKAELVPEKLPWTSILIEEAPLFRDKLMISKASRYG